MSKDLYKDLSEARKLGQLNGTIPEWYTTAAYQMFMDKYLYDCSNIKEQFERISLTASNHVKNINKEQAKNKFFELFWKGWLSPSTPVLANMGTNRGLPV